MHDTFSAVVFGHFRITIACRYSGGNPVVQAKRARLRSVFYGV